MMIYTEYKPPSFTDLRTWAFERHPFHCTDCGCRLNFKNPDFRYKNLMLHANVKDTALCGSCLAAIITKWFKTPLKGLTRKYKNWGEVHSNYECENCHKKKRRVARIIWEPWCDVRFGISSWNGNTICCDCLVECAIKGKSQSGYVALVTGSRYAINEAGARILIE